MKLSDVMSHAGLVGFAEIGLVLFLIAFVVIVIRTFDPSRRRELESAASLPFDEGTPRPQETTHER